MDKSLSMLTCFIASLLFCSTVVGAEQMVTGTVKAVDVAKSSIKLDELELDVTRKTKILIDGKTATIADIKPGQQFKVIYDDKLEAAISIASSGANEATAELVQISELTIQKNYGSHWLTDDGLTIYWEGPERQFWTAKRKTVAERFADQKSLQVTGRHLTVSTDGLELIFIADRNDGKKGESLHSAKRSKKDEPFRRPTEIIELLDKSGEATAKSPFLSSDGLTLYYQSAGSKNPLLYSMRSTNKDHWSTPKPLLISRKEDSAPTWLFVSADGLRLLCFDGYSGAKNKLTAWTRDAVSEPFVMQQVVSISNGEVISGHCPRYVPATRELFFVGNVGSENGPRMFCITNFDSLVPFSPKKDSK